VAEEDKRNKLKDTAFTYLGNKDGKVFLYWHGKRVKILKGQEAQTFLNKIATLNHEAGQLVMAKLTGNFKRGNER
jgi:hypothetical protein